MSDIDTSALQQVLVGSEDQEIVLLEARLRTAQLNADITALGELISDNLLSPVQMVSSQLKRKILRLFGPAHSNFLHMSHKSFVSVLLMQR